MLEYANFNVCFLIFSFLKTGTHYALLATCEVLGKLMFAAIAGWLTDFFGLHIMFTLFTILALLVIPFITFVPKQCDLNHKIE